MPTPRVRRERLKRSTRARRLRRALAGLLLVVAAGGVLFWLGEQVYLFCLAKAVRTVQAGEGSLTAGYSGEAVVLRRETVVRSPLRGYPVRYLPEGSMVRAGDVVAAIKPPPEVGQNQEPIPLTSPVPGFICYHPDGWEGVLSPDQWPRLKPADLFREKGGSRGNRDPIGTGEPVFKVIDNLTSPYLVVRLDRVGDGRPGQGDTVELQWKEGKATGKVVGLETDGRFPVAVVATRDLQPDFCDLRRMEVRMLQRGAQGVIVPSRALTRRGRATGVIVSSPVGFKFIKVTMKGRLGDRVAVTGVEPGTEVVVNPGVAVRLDRGI